MIHQLSEKGNIGGHSCGLVNREELADENLMLVTVKAAMEKFAKFSSCVARNGSFNGMNPALGRTIKMLVYARNGGFQH